MSVILPLSVVQARADVGEQASWFSGDTALLIDLESAEPDLDGARVAGWLRRAGCPVIGIGAGAGAGRGGGVDTPPAVPVIASACDACVDTLDAALALRARIDAAPRAAALWVLLLRQAEALPLEAALFAESLTYATLQAGPEYQAWLARYRAEKPRTARDEGPAVHLRRTGEGWRLTLNRPSTQNAMSVEMRDALLDALAVVAANPHPGGLYIDALGNSFSTGGELSEFGTVPDVPSGHLIRQMALPGRALSALASTAVVRVHGACIGSGIEFPAFAGRIEAHPETVFELPELGFGLIPGAGGSVSVARRIGRQRTAAWVLSGARIDARTARDWGLIDAITD